MSYIKDKLDEFNNRYKNSESIQPYADDIKHFIEQALTDYHNHIVEKIQMLKRKHYNETEFMNHRNDYNDAYNEVLQSVISLLQDTNPKE